MSKPLPRYDVPADAYPFTIEFVNPVGEVVHTITVKGPGRLFIPGLADKHGPVSVRVTYANGTTGFEPPP